MSKLKLALDITTTTHNSLFSPSKKNKTNISNIISQISDNYTIYNTDPFINMALKSIPIPRKLIIKKEKVTINKDINTIDDLLDILANYQPLSNAEYSIDLQAY